MSKTDPEYLKYFGEIKFAEEKSLSASDFESALKRFVNKKEKVPRGRYKPAEINSNSMDDFEESFNEFFE